MRFGLDYPLLARSEDQRLSSKFATVLVHVLVLAASKLLKCAVA